MGERRLRASAVPDEGDSRSRSSARADAHAPRLTHAAGGGMPPLLAPALVAALLCAALLWRSRLKQPHGALRTMVVLGSGTCA